jgi:hypothetical protein
VANAVLALVLDGIKAHIVGRIKESLGEGKRTAFSVAASEGLTVFRGFFEGQRVSGGAYGGLGFLGGRRDQMAAALSMWLVRRVVKCEARVSRSLVEAVDGGVLRMAACK